MKPHLAPLAAIVLALGCDRAEPAPTPGPAPGAASAPRPAPSASARPAAPAAGLSEEQARALVATLSEAARALADHEPMWVEGKPEPGCHAGDEGCAHRVHLGAPVGSPSQSHLLFLVDAVSGDVSVRAPSYVSERFQPYRVWSAQQKQRVEVLEQILALPELRAYAASLRRVGADLSAQANRTPEDGCTAGTPECRWCFDVRENTDHAFSWIVACVDPASHVVRVMLTDGREVSYPVWKASMREHPPWSNLFPPDGHEGPLGYGAPDRIIDSVTDYHHPIKAALAREGLTLVRVELYAREKVPALFVEKTAAAADLEGPGGRAVAVRLLAANGGFPFELIVKPARRRLRFHDETDEGFQVHGEKGWTRP